jgi:hypothetical protein
LTSARSALTASVWVLSAGPFGWAMATAAVCTSLFVDGGVATICWTPAICLPDSDWVTAATLAASWSFRALPSWRSKTMIAAGVKACGKAFAWTFAAWIDS